MGIELIIFIELRIKKFGSFHNKISPCGIMGTGYLILILNLKGGN